MENENQSIKQKCECGECVQCRGFFGSKTNGILLLILIILMIIALLWMWQDRQKYLSMLENKTEEVVQEEQGEQQVKDTYTYTNHGFSIELPIGFVPKETKNRTEASIDITLPGENRLVYVTDLSSMDFGILVPANIKKEKIGDTVFTVSAVDKNENSIYGFEQGNVGYHFIGDTSLVDLLKTFKFVGWPQIEGNKEDLVSFSIKPGQEVSGKVNINGIIKGAYFFEANADVYIMDANKNILRTTYITGLGDWMTSGPVPFTGVLDFTGLPKGSGFITIQTVKGEDSALIKQQIFIPIVIK